MKIRQGFVSNSSSSSFVVINASDGYEKYDCDRNFVVNSRIGTCEFGWGPEDIYDVGSRIIFAYLQTQYSKNQNTDPLVEQAMIATKGYCNEWLGMLEEVIKENTRARTIEWNICEEDDDNKSWGYIDHQSNASEGSNTEIFKSKQVLKDFIFGSNSYIHLDNDNH